MPVPGPRPSPSNLRESKANRAIPLGATLASSCRLAVNRSSGIWDRGFDREEEGAAAASCFEAATPAQRVYVL